jgi:hypothetical protein
MADKAIGALPAVDQVNDQDLFVIEHSGDAMKMEFELFRTYLNRNVVSVVTVAVPGSNTFSTYFNQSNGVLTFYVPAQIMDTYSKAEIDAMFQNCRINANQVDVSETQRLDQVLMYDIEEGRYVKQRACSQALYEEMKEEGTTEAGAMYFPYNQVPEVES